MASDPFRIRVYGIPAPQGSKRHVGRGIMVESSKKLKPWREAVKAAARAFIDEHPEFRMFDCAVAYRAQYLFRRPQSISAKKRPFHVVPPDRSKLDRSMEDALTDAGVWRDDSLVVYSISAKKYVADEPPGAIIEVWEYEG